MKYRGERINEMVKRRLRGCGELAAGGHYSFQGSAHGGVHSELLTLGCGGGIVVIVAYGDIERGKVDTACCVRAFHVVESGADLGVKSSEVSECGHDEN